MVFKTNYCLMQVKSIAECPKGEHSAIFSTFIKLPFVIKVFVLSIFEWPFTQILLVGAQWLSGKMLDLRLTGRRFKPHRCQGVVVLKQDTFILA